VLQIWDLSNEKNAESIEKANKDYCRGKTDPRFEREVFFANEEIFAKDDITNYAEHTFANFSMAILGEFGYAPFADMMRHIKAEIAKDVAAMSVVPPPVISEDEMISNEEDEKNICTEALSYFLQLAGADKADELHNDGVLQLLFIIGGRIETYPPGSYQRDILLQLRSRLHAHGSILISQIIATLNNMVGLKYNVATALFKQLTEAFAEAAENKNGLSGSLLDREKFEYDYIVETVAALKVAELSIPPVGKTPYSLMGNACFAIMKRVFAAWHPDHQVFFRVTLAEVGVLKLLPGVEKIGEDGLLDGKVLIGGQLRTIACTVEIEDELLGSVMSHNEGVDYQALRTAGPVRVVNPEDAVLAGDLLVQLISPKALFDFIAVPLDVDHSGYEGTFDIAMTGESDKFDTPDVKFIQVLGVNLENITCSARIHQTH
jgi:hypothetical protein